MVALPLETVLYVPKRGQRVMKFAAIRSTHSTNSLIWGSMQGYFR